MVVGFSFTILNKNFGYSFLSSFLFFRYTGSIFVSNFLITISGLFELSTLIHSLINYVVFFYLIGILIVLSGVGAYKLINNIIIDANLTSISALLTKRKVKMAGYWPISFLPF